MAAAFALAFCLGAALAPAVGFGQDQKQAPELMAIDLPTAACQNSPKLREICGNDVALVRSIKISPTNEDNRVKVFGKPGTHEIVEDPKDSDMKVTVTGKDDPDADYIEVNVRLSKEFLGRFANNPDDQDVAFYTVSVVGKTGSASCYWDCYWVNGKKICECIQL